MCPTEIGREPIFPDGLRKIKVLESIQPAGSRILHFNFPPAPLVTAQIQFCVVGVMPITRNLVPVKLKFVPIDRPRVVENGG